MESRETSENRSKCIIFLSEPYLVRSRFSVGRLMNGINLGLCLHDAAGRESPGSLAKQNSDAAAKLATTLVRDFGQSFSCSLLSVRKVPIELTRPEGA